VRELYARGDKVKAVTELRAATGLGISDALVIVDKLGKSNRPGSS
jgi:ribosomal protein L7/L12